MAELKPCPFCKAKLIYKNGWYTHPRSSDCLCGIGFGEVIEPITISEECIELWNRRATE